MIKKNKTEHGLGQEVDYTKQGDIPASKLRHGSLKGRIPVMIDSRTTVYVVPGTDEELIRFKYTHKNINHGHVTA